MELQEIDVFIEHDGHVRIEVRGIKGAQCLAETKELERVLGGEITSREMTAEASDSGVSENKTMERQGDG